MRTLTTLLGIGAAFYVLFGLSIYLLQNRMVFLANMPGRHLEVTPAAVGFKYEDVTVTTEDDVDIHGWYLPVEDRRGVVLFFHGNAGNISHRLDSIAIFRELGFDVFIIDYRGYGQSEGRATEQGLYRDAEAAWNHLVDGRNVEPGKIIVFGRSLGGAVASHLVTTKRPAAVIIESCFSSALEMANRLYPFMPVRLITRLKFPVAENVGKSTSPVLVVHSEDDEIIPYALGQIIFAAAPEPKTMVTLNGDHNGAFLLFRERYMTGMAAFIDTHTDL